MRKINYKLLITLMLLSGALAFGFAKTGMTKRIKFAKGKSSATIKNSVLRDEVHYYLVKVNKGQKMAIKITSVEKNASFRILKPAGGYLEGANEMTEPTDWSGTAQQSGDYKIEVASDRGNATYRLTVSVK